MRTSVRSVGAAPSTGLAWMKSVTRVAERQTASSRRPSTSGGSSVRNARTDGRAGRANPARGPLCTAGAGSLRGGGGRLTAGGAPAAPSPPNVLASASPSGVAAAVRIASPAGDPGSVRPGRSAPLIGRSPGGSASEPPSPPLPPLPDAPGSRRSTPVRGASRRIASRIRSASRSWRAHRTSWRPSTTKDSIAVTLCTSINRAVKRNWPPTCRVAPAIRKSAPTSRAVATRRLSSAPCRAPATLATAPSTTARLRTRIPRAARSSVARVSATPTPIQSSSAAAARFANGTTATVGGRWAKAAGDKARDATRAATPDVQSGRRLVTRLEHHCA